MTSRLAAFSADIDMNSSLDDDEDFTEIDLDNLDFENSSLDNITESLESQIGHLPAYVISHAKPILQASSGIMGRANKIIEMLLEERGEIQNPHLLIKAAKELSESAELILIAAEMLIHNTDQDAECKIIASAQLVRAAVSALFAQFKSYGDNPDPEGILQGHVKTVQIFTAKIQRKLTQIVRQKVIQKKSTNYSKNSK